MPAPGDGPPPTRCAAKRPTRDWRSRAPGSFAGSPPVPIAGMAKPVVASTRWVEGSIYIALLTALLLRSRSSPAPWTVPHAASNVPAEPKASRNNRMATRCLFILEFRFSVVCKRICALYGVAAMTETTHDARRKSKSRRPSIEIRHTESVVSEPTATAGARV